MGKNITYRVEHGFTYNDFDTYGKALEFADKLIDEYREDCKNSNGVWDCDVYSIKINEIKKLMVIGESGGVFEAKKRRPCGQYRIIEKTIEVDDYELVGV